MSLISNNLKYLRRINGLTQDQFARRIGTKRANVGAYEEARAVPPVDTLKIIANTFGISVDDFVKKDIRKLRETPDLTFGFEAKSTYNNDVPKPEDDPFDFPPSVGDLMNRFLGDDNQSQERNTEMVAQKVMLKPADKLHYESTSYVQNTVSNQPKDFAEPKYISEPLPTQKNTIQIVKRFQHNDYLTKSNNVNFLKSLTEFHLPTLPPGEYRAFESGEDFAFDGALLVGSIIKNWYDIADGKNYVLVSKPHGIIYRRIYNQIKIKGTLLLSSDNHRFGSTEISINDVIEIWEIKAFISYTLPEPSISFDKLNHLVGEMKFELDRLKK
jgi:transcriptional regulator with XRE-family HTH domain